MRDTADLHGARADAGPARAAARRTPPAPGSALDVAPGVAWHRVPLDGEPDHVNLWLVDEGDGRCAVDCGPTRESTARAWARLEADGPLRDSPLRRVLVTHLHPDHLGYAHALCARWRVPLWMSRADFGQARRGLEDPELHEAGLRLLARNGFDDPEAHAALRARRVASTALLPALPPGFVPVADGDAVRLGAHDWHAIGGRGHAPEHLAFHCPALGALVSGDLLLPAIVAHVGVAADEPDGDPLGEHLASIGRFAALPDDTLVLPSHGEPFRGIAARLARVRAHHARRLEAALRACDRAVAAADLVPPALRRRLGPHRASLAVGGALAHLHRHWHAGRLRRVEGDDGVLRFERTSR